MILVASTTVEPFLSAVFDRVGADAHSALRRFVGALLGRPAPDAAQHADGDGRTDGDRAPRAVIFESSTTGAQFVFTDDLPAAAYQQAVTLDPPGGRGRWVWASGQEAWLPLEERPA
jgi:hypothetical protein